jgi:phage tail sheath protein FI
MRQPASVGHSLAGGDESLPGSRALVPVATAVTAFVGRTLKGPVNEPVCINSLAQYAQVFGGQWQSAPLSAAVEQYFEHGGELAVIVRVASGGQAPTLDLPAGEQTLVLVGICPGSREFLRASVDYDGIDPANRTQFNLVVQRLRTAGSGLVEQQEVFRRCSITPGVDRDLRSVLIGSRLVRVQGNLTAVRPQPTRSAAEPAAANFIDCNFDGNDGQPLSDYDIIGNHSLRSGLFALDAGPAFNFLCIPDLAPGQSVGMATLVVATRFCRKNHALLLVDPPLQWCDAETALAQLPQWPFHSADAVMFYPRVRLADPQSKATTIFGSAAVVAGLMARNSSADARWWQTEGVQLALADAAEPAVAVSEAQRKALAQAGINTLTDSRHGASVPLVPYTLLGAQGHEPQTLLAKRLELWLAASIERGTRWALNRRGDPAVWARVQQQVSELLEQLQATGALPQTGTELFVICDQRLNEARVYANPTLRLLYGVSTQGTGQYCAWLVVHEAAGSSTRRVSVSRMATSGRHVAAEIEADLLRNLPR